MKCLIRQEELIWKKKGASGVDNVFREILSEVRGSRSRVEVKQTN